MSDIESVMAAVEPLIEPLARRMYSESCVTDGEYMSSVRRFPEYQRLADAVAEAIAQAVVDVLEEIERTALKYPKPVQDEGARIALAYQLAEYQAKRRSA